MLKLAVDSGIPLIKVTTDDLLNWQEILQYVCGVDLIFAPNLQSLGGDDKVVVSQQEIKDEKSLKDLYNKMLKEERTCILVNPKLVSPLYFDAGHLEIPKAMKVKEVMYTGISQRTANSLLPALNGLNLKQIAEVCRIAMTRFGELTPQAVNEVKMMVLPEPLGLSPVATKQDFYIPDQTIDKFVDLNGYFFLTHDDHRLRPRGILLHGMPGTGKSQAAKYIANEWGVPLYMMDLATVMGKYVGQSEGNMRNMIHQLNSEAPCILLLDEVEKLFGDKTNDGGVTNRILGQLLWWLQEHTSKVFTVMTSNDISILPKELYREGRIDMVYELGGLKKSEAMEFIALMKAQFPGVTNWRPNQVTYSKVVCNDIGRVAHASLVKAVYDEVKENFPKEEDQ